MLRFGVITQLDTAGHRARVRFPAEDLRTDQEDPGMESAWLPVLVQWSLGARAYCLPALEEQVVVWLDEEAADGVILGGIYSEADAPPAPPAQARHLVFPDGTVLEYDPEAHLLKADVQGDVEVTATGSALVDAASATVRAGTITLDGDVTCSGTFHADGAATFGSTVAADGKISTLQDVDAVAGTKRAGVPYNFP